jgi:hypothetical protein
MATAKQLAANRENAKSSPGPVTPEGKFISSHNAVKTGLTGQTVLLKTDDVEAYKAHIQRINDEQKPARDNERALVQDLADTEWRLLRIVPLESGIWALGRMKLAPQFEFVTDPAERALLLDAEVQLTYAKDLRNLALQHTRLCRHRANVLQELKDLQRKRKDAANLQSMRAAQVFFTAIDDPQWKYFDLTDFGFDFTQNDFFAKIAEIRSLRERHNFPEVMKNYCMEQARDAFYEKWGNPDEQQEEE